MDEPLCFVNFINALTCSHKESDECCSGDGDSRNARRLLPFFQPYFPGKDSREVNGIEHLACQGSGPPQRREEVASLLWPNCKHYVLEETKEDTSFWEDINAQGNFCFKSGTCLSDLLDLGLDPRIGRDR